MTLQEWYTEKLKDLAEFVRYWDENSQLQPDEYPDDCLTGDWDEQFEFFCEESF